MHLGVDVSALDDDLERVERRLRGSKTVSLGQSSQSTSEHRACRSESWIVMWMA